MRASRTTRPSIMGPAVFINVIDVISDTYLCVAASVKYVTSPGPDMIFSFDS